VRRCCAVAATADRSAEQGSVVVALLTPFRADRSVDVGALERHLESLVEAGVDAVMPAGTTGEGVLLDDDEIVATVEAAVRAASGAATVLAHVGRAGTAATVRLARRALDVGADAVSAVVPYYYALDDARVVAHFTTLIAAVDGTAAYAYTIPARAGNDLSASAAAELVALGIGGIKDSTKSIERHAEYVALGTRVLMGSDGLVLDALRLGAAGCVSAIANLRPELLVGLVRAHASGRRDEAERLQREVSNMRTELAREPALVGLKRAVAERIDGYPSALRAPL
jgi:dihydrodipicolinate synthase/N-acetylneuraminate lyase